ncbi:MAG TPA: hypothetical protein P5186_25925 [Candidatus Paceibacterota bacterium]|nr:hypothetical protein [Verrucomicrobiota bacterium]HRY51498.1 hypothetical protein [Candidatus Paceibacterota bacterium]
MSNVNELIVREFFELKGFFVRQPCKHVATSRRDEEEIDLLVANPRPQTATTPLPFVLAPHDLACIPHALITIKGWHSETFSVAFMSYEPDLFRFMEEGPLNQASRSFEPGSRLVRLLVISSLPQTDDLRQQSLQFLRDKGIDGVLLFSDILAELIDQTEERRNYQKSDLLQLIRLLKHYRFFREPQLELFRSRRRSPRQRQTRKSQTSPSAPTGEDPVATP